MIKSDLIDLVLTDEEKRSVDPELSPIFITDCENLLGIDPCKYYISIEGLPVNLAELYVERYLVKHAVLKTIIDINEH